jgi:hypothetical protein
VTIQGRPFTLECAIGQGPDWDMVLMFENKADTIYDVMTKIILTLEQGPDENNGKLGR